MQHIATALALFGRGYADQDAAIVAISSNDPATHPDDRPEKLASEAKRLGYRFPVLFDESQEVLGTEGELFWTSEDTGWMGTPAFGKSPQ